MSGHWACNAANLSMFLQREGLSIAHQPDTVSKPTPRGGAETWGSYLSPRQPLTWVCRWPSIRGGPNRDSTEWVAERLGAHTGRFRGAVAAAASLLDCDADARETR